MPEWWEIFFSILIIAWATYCLWGIYCGHRTYVNRMHLIEKLKELEDRGTFFELIDYQRRVSFDEHKYELMRFKNPWLLYDVRIQELMK